MSELIEFVKEHPVATVFIALGLLLIGDAMINGGSYESKDLYKSATEKIDSGRAHELTASEKQRLYDITYGWCTTCDTAQRLCKHRN